MRAICDDSLIEDAVRCKKNGMSNKDIIAYLGIGESTFYRWVNQPKNPKQEELGESLKKAEVDFKAALRARIISSASDSWQAAAWMLERMYPEEYAKPEVQFAHAAAKEAAAEAISDIKDVLVSITEVANEPLDSVNGEAS